MPADARDRRPHPEGAGALRQTEVERVDLGEHGGRRLTARVEHRTFRLVLGAPGARDAQGRAFSLTLGRRRVVALEVRPAARGDTGAGAGGYDGRSEVPVSVKVETVAVETPADPWSRYVRRVALVLLGGWVLGRIAARLR